MQMTFSYLAGHGERGMSFTELVVVIAVLGVLAAIAIPAITGAFAGTQQATAVANLALLNQAVLRYNHANTNLVSTPDSSADDEVVIFQLLQVRDTNVMGSPFVSQTMTAGTSTNAQTYRATWNGRMFETNTPGHSGAGLNLLEMKESGAH